MNTHIQIVEKQTNENKKQQKKSSSQRNRVEHWFLGDEGVGNEELVHG